MINKSYRKVILFDIDHTLFQTQLFWDSNCTEYKSHQEAPEALRRLAGIATLAIFSEGKKDFQITKLHKTHLYHFFHHRDIHIYDAKMQELAAVLAQYKGKDIFLVDDKLTVLHDASRLDPSIKTIWVARGFFAEKQNPIKGFSPSLIIKDLSEMVPFISAT